MGLFSFFKKETKQQVTESDILLAMPIFKNGGSYEIKKVIDDLISVWDIEVTNIEGDDQVTSFDIEEETIAIASMPVPIPFDDIEGTAKYAYNWPKAAEELKDHTGHAIVSMMGGKSSTLNRFRIMTKVLHAILVTSDAVGIYKGSQSLLILRLQYIKEVEQNDTPISLWVYIGLRKNQNKNSAYTYGLKEFGKQELEVVDSFLSMEDLYNFLANVAHYIISNNVTLKNGETIGSTVNEKITIKASKGVFVDGVSLKLEI